MSTEERTHDLGYEGRTNNVCERHGELSVAIARIEERLISQNEKASAIYKIITKHVSESDVIRDTVKKNESFRLALSKGLWVIYSTMIVNIVGIIGMVALWVHK